MAGIENIIKHQVLEAAKVVEEQLDNELERLEKLDLDDIENLREKRRLELKKKHKQQQEYLALGHGEYYEITEEKECFEIMKKSKNMVVHFYKNDSPRCKIVDHHLKILTKKHLEARFCTLDVERAPFFTERLNIRVIPTILMIIDAVTVDRVVGFSDLGNCDDFSTEMLEWRIAQSKCIKYTGDLLVPPEQQKTPHQSLLTVKKKTIRGGNQSSDDDEE